MCVIYRCQSLIILELLLAHLDFEDGGLGAFEYVLLDVHFPTKVKLQLEIELQ